MFKKFEIARRKT